MAKSDRKRAGDDQSPALSVAPSQAMFLGAVSAGVLAKKGMHDPKRRIAKAEGLRSSVSPLNLHRMTGVTFGKDDKPRFEIADNKAEMTGRVPRKGMVFLKDVFKHDMLYSAVPTAETLTLARGPKDMVAEATVTGNHIDLNPKYFRRKSKGLSVASDAIPILLHEIQHHVQDIEKFANGGEPNDFLDKFPNSEEDRNKAYKELAGEVEARLTANRHDMSDIKRRVTFPKPDVSLEDQRIAPNTNHRRDFIDFQGVKDAASNAFQQLFNKDMADNKPARFRKLDPKSITSDPSTFQFKSGGDNHGVTDRLKGVKSWDNVAAGKAVVFERANGELVIADGHQRLGLAKRLASEGQKINMDAYVLRERDGWSARDVYAYAALKNIKESSGQALDMAKVMRERPDLVNGSVPLSDAKVRDAANLAKLSKPAFDMVVGGVIKPEYAAQVGARIGDSARHADMLTEMAKANVGSAQHAGLYVDQALAAGSITQHQSTLFGEETNTRSLIAERASVLDKALSSLKSDKRIFSLLEREAGTIEGAGNKLSHETNAARAEEAGNVGALVERLAKNRGPVSDMLETAARQMAEGKKPQVAARTFVKSVGDALKAGGMRALTGDAPETHQMVDKNQTSMFGVEPPKSGEHHVWDDKARAASAEARKAKAKPIETSQPSTQPKGDSIMSHVTKVPRAPRAAKAGAAYEIIDRQTGKVVGTTKSLNGARRAVDRRDTAHGASRYMHRKIANPVAADPKPAAPSPASAEKPFPKFGTSQQKTEIFDSSKVRMSIGDGQGDMMPKATTKDKIAAESRKKAAKGRTGDPADHGLFSSDRHQTDLVTRVDDMVKRIEGPRRPFADIIKSSADAPDPMTRTSKASPIKDIKKRADTTGRSTVRKKQPVGAAIDKVTSGKRGTQNEANLDAINTNRKAKAKGKAQASNLPNPIEIIDARNRTARAHAEIAKSIKRTSPGAAKQRVAIGKDLVTRNEADLSRLESRAAQLNAKAPMNTLDLVTGGAGDERPMWKREGITKLDKGLAFNGDRVVVARTAEPKPVKRGGGKLVGALAPIGIGAAMILASSQAKAEGRDTGEQIKEAAKEGVKGGAVMAGFTVGTAAVTGGLMRAGMTAAKAIPATSVALMGFGAVSEGISAYRRGEGFQGIAKAAAKGAWDMSLPGMVVNTGVAVHDAFNAANTAYRAPSASPAPASDTGVARRGWANPTVQAAAQAAKGRSFNGFTRADLR